MHTKADKDVINNDSIAIFSLRLLTTSTVPPVIIESVTSNDMVVREGTNVSLVCKARGYPEPYVKCFPN